jgi:hypothetical protein
MKAGIAEPEEMSIASQWLHKHVSTATNSFDRGNDYARNNRGLVGSGAFFGVRPEAIYPEPNRREPSYSTI